MASTTEAKPCIVCKVGTEFSAAMKKRKKPGQRRCVDCVAKGAQGAAFTSQLSSMLNDPACRSYLDGHSDRIFDLVFNPNPSKSSLLLSASEDCTVKVWDTSSSGDAALKTSLAGHKAEVLRCVWDPSGQLIGTGSADGTAKLWDLEQGLRATLVHDRESQLYACSFLSQGNMLTAGDDQVKIWDLVTGEEGWSRRLKSVGGFVFGGAAKNPNQIVSVFDVRSGPQGQIACAASDGTVRLLDSRGKVEGVVRAHGSHCTSLRWVGEGPQLLTCEGAGERLIRLWDARKLGESDGQARPLSTMQGHDRCVWGINCISKEDEKDAFVGLSWSSDQICLWELSKGAAPEGQIQRPVETVQVPEWSLLSVAVSPASARGHGRKARRVALGGLWEKGAQHSLNPIPVVDLVGSLSADSSQSSSSTGAGLVGSDKGLMAYLMNTITRQRQVVAGRHHGGHGHSHGGRPCGGHGHGHGHNHGGEGGHGHSYGGGGGHGHSHGGRPCGGH